MKRLLSIIVTLFLLFSCNNPVERKNENKVKPTNQKAFGYYNAARKLNAEFTTERDTVLKAVALLDSAIVINPEYSQALLKKQAYLLRLGEYENALNILKILEKLTPANVDIKSTLGVYYLLSNEPDSAAIRLSQADSLWNIALDTISPDNKGGLLHILMNKATLLKFSGKEEEANKIYRGILADTAFNNETYEGIVQGIDSFYIKQSKESLCNFLQEARKQNEVSSH